MTEENRELRCASDSAVVCTHLVMPPDTNALGNAFGGRIMSWMDIAAGVSAYRFCRRPAVTVAMDNIHFAEAIHLGDIVVVKAQVDYVGVTSMEISVSVDVDNVKDDTHKHCLDGFFTFVAVGDDGHSTTVPVMFPTTTEEQARWDAAELRRKNRPKRKDK